MRQTVQVVTLRGAWSGRLIGEPRRVLILKSLVRLRRDSTLVTEYIRVFVGTVDVLTPRPVVALLVLVQYHETICWLSEQCVRG